VHLERPVDGHHRFDEIETVAQVCQGAWDRCDSQLVFDEDVPLREVRPTNGHADAG